MEANLMMQYSGQMIDSMMYGPQDFRPFALGAGLMGIIAIVIIVLIMVPLCLLFPKIGHKRYEALISGHNLRVIVTQAGKPGRRYFIPFIGRLLVFIPFVGIVIGGIVIFIRCLAVHIALAKRFGKNAGFGVGLTILPFIFYPILGFGRAKYSNKLAR